MDRRNFMGKAGCAAAALVTAAGFAGGQEKASPAAPPAPPPKPKRYKIEIEIYEALPPSWCHKKGDKFAYPADWGKLCPWLRRASTNSSGSLRTGSLSPGNTRGRPTKK